VVPCIHQHVGERVPHLARAGEDALVVALGEHSAGAPERAVHGEREARAERLHRAPERGAIARLDDQVHVVALDRVVDEPEARPLLRSPKGGFDCPHDAPLAK
jgi:hypothetical protein